MPLARSLARFAALALAALAPGRASPLPGRAPPLGGPEPPAAAPPGPVHVVVAGDKTHSLGLIACARSVFANALQPNRMVRDARLCEAPAFAGKAAAAAPGGRGTRPGLAEGRVGRAPHCGL